jgi:hypothetical protein
MLELSRQNPQTPRIGSAVQPFMSPGSMDEETAAMKSKSHRFTLVVECCEAWSKVKRCEAEQAVLYAFSMRKPDRFKFHLLKKRP